MTRPPAYVGVSGVVTPAQAIELTRLAADCGLTDRRSLLLGVKATHKTQFLDVENKYGHGWYPVGDQLTVALGSTSGGPGSQRVAQIYLEADLVHEQEYRDNFMGRVLDRGAGWLTGVQFDMLPWHTAGWAPGFLADLRAAGLAVLLQCHGPAMTELGPSGCADLLGELARAEALDYVLFDSSHGTGKQLDVESLRDFVAHAYGTPWLDHVGIAVAGGLDEYGVAHLAPLIAEFPDLSWDAEGKLHPETTATARPLDVTVVGYYLAASAAMVALGAGDEKAAAIALLSGAGRLRRRS